MGSPQATMRPPTPWATMKAEASHRGAEQRGPSQPTRDAMKATIELFDQSLDQILATVVRIVQKLGSVLIGRMVNRRATLDVRMSKQLLDGLVRFGVIFAVVVLLSDWTDLLGETVGRGYCEIRHPVESLYPVRNRGCESQHVVQLQEGGTDRHNTIWINAVLHAYLDLSKDRPWERERPWAGTFADENAERAYMIGVYANGFHFAVYDHHGNGHATLTEWDGVSHLIYGVSSVFNFVTKEMTYLGYQIERANEGKKTQWIDAVLGVCVDLIEVLIGLGYCAVGVVIGSIFNPVDTIINVPGGILLILEAIVEGIANTISDVVSLVSLGWVEL